MPDPVILPFVLYAVIGAGAGLLAGLLGVGGGLVIVPCMSLLLGLQGFPEAVRMQTAVGTSLAVICITAIVSVRAHHKLAGIDWEWVKRLAPSLAIGAIFGAILARLLPGTALKLCVGLFELWVALRMILPNVRNAPHVPAPGKPRLVGSIIGSLSALVGIGGGTLIVPYLLRHGATIHRAIGVAAASGLPIALLGSITFLILGWNDPHLPSVSLGYILPPAFVPITIGALLFAPLGARLAHSLPTAPLKRTFALFLTITGIMMLAT